MWENGAYHRNISVRLAYETGTLDTLYQVLLAEEVHDNERKYDHKAGCVLYYCSKHFEYRVPCIENFKRRRKRYDLRHCPRCICALEEQIYIELVCLLP